MTCDGHPIRHQSHFSTKDGGEPKHVKVKLSAAETHAWIQAEIKKLLEDNADDEPVLASPQQAAADPGQSQPLYRISFGCHKGSTVLQIMKKAPSYFASLVQQTPRKKEPLHDRPGCLMLCKFTKTKIIHFRPPNLL